MNEINIQYDANPTSEETKQLWKGISAHAKQVAGLDPGEGFAFYLRDESQTIVGGCSGYVFYGNLYVDMLYVAPAFRGKAWGTQLMKCAEQLGKEKNCQIMTVNTMDFEARGFYEKLGFYVEFERNGFEKNHRMFFLKKEMT